MLLQVLCLPCYKTLPHTASQSCKSGSKLHRLLMKWFLVRHRMAAWLQTSSSLELVGQWSLQQRIRWLIQSLRAFRRGSGLMQ